MKLKKILKYILIIVITVILLFVANILVKTLTIKDTNTNSNDTNTIVEENTIEDDLIPNDVIGTLEIPKINLKAQIKEGVDLDTLKTDIGHFPNSSIWNGNIALASHNRGSNVAHYFQDINKLEKGDLIIYKSEMGERRYKVTDIQEIESTDWSKIEDTKENKITLITCVANKPELRLCVQGEETKE